MHDIRHLFSDYQNKINYLNNYHLKKEKDEVWKKRQFAYAGVVIQQILLKHYDA